VLSEKFPSSPSFSIDAIVGVVGPSTFDCSRFADENFSTATLETDIGGLSPLSLPIATSSGEVDSTARLEFGLDILKYASQSSAVSPGSSVALGN
jgi:hypothetical protein